MKKIRPQPRFRAKKRNRITQSLVDTERHIYRYEVLDNIPRPIFKAFDERAHAENFCSGEVWFNSLDYYRSIEDVRKDKTEGIGEISVDGKVLEFNPATGQTSPRPGREGVSIIALKKSHFICCFSRQHNGGFTHLPKRFGRWYVKIDEPLKLMRVIAIAMMRHKQLKINPPYLEAQKVKYDKCSYYGVKPGNKKLLRLAWAQKAENFSDEWEYRLHMQICLNELALDDSYFKLRVEDISPFCKIIERTL